MEHLHKVSLSSILPEKYTSPFIWCGVCRHQPNHVPWPQPVFTFHFPGFPTLHNNAIFYTSVFLLRLIFSRDTLASLPDLCTSAMSWQSRQHSPKGLPPRDRFQSNSISRNIDMLDLSHQTQSYRCIPHSSSSYFSLGTNANYEVGLSSISDGFRCCGCGSPSPVLPMRARC